MLNFAPMIQFLALFMLMLVTGIFWGPWFALHRSIGDFNAAEFIHIVQVMAANLAKPMRIMMPVCILFIALHVVQHQHYLAIISLSLLLVALLITMLVEVPIVNQVKQWTVGSLPSDWEEIRDRWVTFHVIRTAAAIISFSCLALS
jgi:hypothetical protein